MTNFGIIGAIGELIEEFVPKNGTQKHFAYEQRFTNDKGYYHRIDGPAYKTKYGESWYINGKRHRLDGPANIVNGYHPRKDWYLFGKYVPCKSQEEFERLLKIGRAFW